MGRLTVVKNPFAPWDGRLVKEVPAGRKVRDIIAPFTGCDFRISVSLNGELDPDLDRVVEEGDTMTIMAQVGDKDAVRLVGLIVVVALVSYFTFGTGAGTLAGLTSGMGAGGGALLGAGATGFGAFATYAIGGALSAGGMWLLNEVLPPETQNISAGQSLTDGNTYGWGDPRNQTTEGLTVPVLYGKHLITPQVISQRRSFENNKDKMNVLFLLTEGRSNASTPTVYLNDREISNYTGATVAYRRGDITQTNIGGGFDDIVTQKAVNTILDPSTSDTVTVQTDGTAVEKLTVGVSVPGGLYAYIEGGYHFLYTGVYIEYRAVGALTWIPFDGMSATVTYTSTEWQDVQVGTEEVFVENGGSQQYTTIAPVYERQLVTSTKTIPMPSVGFWWNANTPDTIRSQFDHGSTPLTPDQYEVRITKTFHHQPLQGNGSYSNVVRVDFLEEVIEEPLTYPGRTILGITSVAQEEIYGSSPVVQVEADRGELLLYQGEWGNSTVVTGRASSNPAWACYDLLTNPLYGGNIHPDNIIEAEFQAWADYCDARGLECNIYLEAGSTMLESLRKVSILGWGSVVQRGTSYGAIYDGPQTMSYVFGMGNILAGTFNMSYIEHESRARTVEVTYWDRTLGWDRRILKRRLDETSGETDFRKASIQLPGCTSRTQADLHAQLALRKNQYITRTVRFQAEMDAIHCQAGDVIGVSHDIPRYGISGRVVSGTTTSVTLDHTITLTADTYYITLKYADDTSETVQVNETNGSFSTLTIASGTFSSTPAKNDVYAVGLVDSTVRQFRVVSIRKTQDFQAEILAVEYRPEIYNFDTAVPDYPPNKLIASVQNLRLAESYQVFNDGTVRAVLNVDWDGFSTEWNVKIWDTGSGNSSPEWNKDVSERRVAMPVNQPDIKRTYRVRVTGLDGLYVEDTIVFQLDKPTTPINLTTKVVDKMVQIDWEQPASELPVVKWEVYEGLDFLNATRLGVVSQPSFTGLIPQGGFNLFHVVAVDSAGQKSNHAFVSVWMDTTDGNYTELTGVSVDGSGSGSNFYWEGTELWMPFTDPGDDWDTVWQSAYPVDYATKTWDDWLADKGVQTYMDAVLQVPGTSWATTSTYTQTWDLGEEYPRRTRVEVLLNKKQLVGPTGSVVFNQTIEYSADNVTWYAYKEEIISEHGGFRYVRVTITATGDGQSAVAIKPVLKLSARDRKEIGSGTITDANAGLTVNFNFAFYEVRSIKVIPQGTSVRIGGFDFTDVPFPTSFQAYLYNTSDTKVTGDFYYEIEGI